jgi:isopenicillin N synthase-like dioxygenase
LAYLQAGSDDSLDYGISSLATIVSRLIIDSSMKVFDARRLQDEEFDASFLSALGDACRTTGVFQLTGAQVLFDDSRVAHTRESSMETIVSDAVEATTSLFALPLEEKRQFQRLPGRTAMGWSNCELTKQRLDLKELWDISWVSNPDRHLEHASNVSIDGYNRLPEGDVRDRLLAYYRVAKDTVCDPLYRALCAALELDFDAVQAVTIGDNPKSLGFLRLNHYWKHADDEGMNIHVRVN